MFDDARKMGYRKGGDLRLRKSSDLVTVYHADKITNQLSSGARKLLSGRSTSWPLKQYGITRDILGQEPALGGP